MSSLFPGPMSRTERSGANPKAGLPAAILLDLDDTILASSDVADECWRTLCVRYASELTAVSAEKLYASVSQWRDWFWSDAERHRAGRNDLQSARRQIVRMAFEDEGIDEPYIAEQLADSYTIERERNVRPFPGAIEALQALHERRIPLVLVTNGSSAFQRAKIDRFNLQQYFRAILIEGELGVGKPHKSVFEHALKAVDCLPGNAWMVGDSLMYDVEPALELGMHGVWMDFAESGLPQSPRCIPSRIISSFSGLLELLAESRGR
jgi:putative hydrolase of the HAD superfamily